MDELTTLLEADDGVLHVRDWPNHARALARWCRQGRLIRLLRGLYVAPGAERDTRTLIRAVARAYPDAIFTGLTAAWLNGHDVRVREVTAIHRGRSLRFGRVRLLHGTLPDEVWGEHNGLRYLTQAMTAIDVIPHLGAQLIDALLLKARDGAQVLRRLWSAFAATPARAGNRERRRVLERSATHPWSEAERRAHDLLDQARITGWVANAELTVEGQRIHPDITFERDKLVVEIDGYTHHCSREAFQRDRTRQNRLTVAGWRVLRFTWDDIAHRPQQVIDQITDALFSARSPLG